MTIRVDGTFTGDLAIEGQRLALATFATGARMQRGDEIHYLDMASGDLTMLNKRAPFLCEHRFYIEDLLGCVQEAWLEDDRAMAIVRFNTQPMAERVWSLIQDDFTVGCSVGYSILSARPVEVEQRSGFVVDAWAATEISACITGADAGAHISCRPLEELAALREQRMARRLERERSEKIAALRGDAWRHWATNGAAEFVGAAAGVSAHKIQAPLISAVERHLAELESHV
jgi:hypothetical protein